MTTSDNQKNSHRIAPQTDEHSDEPWIIGMFAVCGLIATAFVLFVAGNPDAGKLASDIAQAEFPVIQSAPATTDAIPALRSATRLAAGR